MNKKLSNVILSALFVTGSLLGNIHLIHANPLTTKLFIENIHGPYELDLGKTPLKQVNNISLIPLRTISEELGSKVDYNNQTGEINITDPSGIQIKLLLENTTVQKNNQNISLEVAPRTYNNTTYVPLRFVSEALGYDVKWDSKANTITLSKNYIESKHFVYNYKNNSLLMKNEDGQYTSLAENIFSSDLDYLTIDEIETQNGNYVLSLNNNYGEPHIHDEHLNYYISGDKIIGSTRCDYWRISSSYLRNYGLNTVAMTNGSDVKVYDDTSLTLTHTIDLKSMMEPTIEKYVEHLTADNSPVVLPKEDLIGSITSAKYMLEGVGENYILVRGGTGALTLIDLDTKEVTPLYEHLLSPSELALLGNGYGFFEIGDGFTFTKQEGNKLYFNNSILNDNQYIYELK